MKKLAVLALVGSVLLIVPQLPSGGSEKASGAAKAHYIDGTVPDLKKGAEGTAQTSGADEFVFEYREGALKIPYGRISKLQFGLKSHISVGYHIITGIHPKKVRDYALTIEYQDANGAAQTAVFKLSKDGVFVSLINLQTRTNKDIDFENKKACEYAKKNAPPGQIDLDCSKMPK